MKSEKIMWWKSEILNGTADILTLHILLIYVSDKNHIHFLAPYAASGICILIYDYLKLFAGQMLVMHIINYTHSSNTNCQQKLLVNTTFRNIFSFM